MIHLTFLRLLTLIVNLILVSLLVSNRQNRYDEVRIEGLETAFRRRRSVFEPISHTNKRNKIRLTDASIFKMVK